MRQLAGFAMAVAVLAACQTGNQPTPDSADLVGKVTHVRDADTIEVNGQAVRLNGVDAAELSSTAGRAGRDWMRATYLGRQAVCDLTGAVTYDRVVGTCYVGDIDVAAVVISAGYALDCRRYSGGKYASLELASTRETQRRASYC